MEILNSENFGAAERVTSPFTYAIIPDPILEQHREQMLSKFPTDDYSEVIRNDGYKDYKMYVRHWITPSNAEVQNGDLAPVWMQLLGDLLSREYRAHMSSLSNIDLLDCSIEATFWRYDSSCFLEPHTDKPEKLATHLIYFNRDWDQNWGGTLNLHNGTDGYPVFRTIAPTIGNSVVLVTSCNSWHSVQPVTAVGAQRRSLQIVFRRQLSREV